MSPQIITREKDEIEFQMMNSVVFEGHRAVKNVLRIVAITLFTLASIVGLSYVVAIVF